MDIRDPVCLLIPPSAFLLDERVFISLGILKIAAVLEQANYEVEVVDLSGIHNYTEVLQQHLLTSSARIFGITATTPQMPQVNDIVSSIRTFKSGSKIIFGGPHVTLVHTAAEKEIANNFHGRAAKALESLKQSFDVLISGDGEKAIFPALEMNSPKLINANRRNSMYFLSNTEFDKALPPARHLIDLQSYHYSIDGIPATSIIGQLGCPFSCGFCGGRESPCLRIVRVRSIQSIISEIKHVYETYSLAGFMFYDDELNVNPHFMDLLEALYNLKEHYGVPFHFRGFIKAELFNEKQAGAMYKAGFRWILSGFESGSPRILSNIRKRATIEDNTRCVKIAQQSGLKVKALMSIGHPGESSETIAQTEKWIMSSKPDDLDVTIITPYPGTAYYDYAIPGNDNVWIYTIPENGDRLYSFEVDYTTTAVYYKGDPVNGYKAFTYTDYLSPEQLVQQRGYLDSTLRTKLNLPQYQTKTSMHFEHSMGQAGVLPEFIVKSSLQGIKI